MEIEKDHLDSALAWDLIAFTARSSLKGRREMLRLIAGASFIPFLGCWNSSASPTGGEPSSCAVIPEETAGPYPGDGSNGPNILTQSGIVRSDIRSSIGSASGTAAGITLTVTLELVNTNDGCAPLAGYAIYLWHCDLGGQYSMYTLPTENYLRGVQATDPAGMVTFTSIFPGCYAGRWPHIHFEIYPSIAQATSAASKVKTSQLAFPDEVCDDVYATTGYEQSVRNLAGTSLSRDGIFSDGVDFQMATMTGSAANGLVANLVVGIAV